MQINCKSLHEKFWGRLKLENKQTEVLNKWFWCGLYENLTDGKSDFYLVDLEFSLMFLRVSRPDS